MKKFKKILILVEGETEEKLVKTLNIVGKIRKINLWEKDISKIIATIKEDNVVIVFDTDKVEMIQRFITNLKILEKHKIKFSLVQQSKNLEDEVIYCSKCKRIQDVFNTQGVKEFKNEWNKCQNLDNKLHEIYFDSNKLWTRTLIKPLEKWKDCQKSFKELSIR